MLCVALAALAWAHGTGLADSVLIGVSLAVAAVPEGLPAVITVTLAVGMHRLAGRGAIVRRLPAVEALGSVTVMCTDKTGTLTENRMSLARLSPVAGEDRLLRAALIASDPAGGPEDAAVVAAAAAAGATRASVLRGAEVVGGAPFDPVRRLMSVVIERDGQRSSCVKGAPEAVLPRLAGSARDLELTAATWAEQGMRVLMVARSDGLRAEDDPERELRPLGLVALADPPRRSAAPAVAAARGGGIRIVMITGDHPRTAAAVARACGIGDGSSPRVITGAELDQLSDEELRYRVGAVDVFARAVPAHKLRIVDALQRGGAVVAMTGDGVNDAPALAAADVGVAMGPGGSDAAKDAADIVLTDNDFATIVAAVEAGRTVYRNIVRFIRFLLAANTGEVLVFAVAIAVGLPAPLTILQILLVNLLTDGLAAVALGLDPPDRDVMRRRPRPPSEGILAPIARSVVAGGVLTGLAAFTSFLIGWQDGEQVAQTMCFATLLFAQLAYVFAVRGDRAFFRAGWNPSLVAAVAGSAVLGAAVLAITPLAARFGAVALGGVELAAALALALIPFAVTELAKVARRGR